MSKYTRIRIGPAKSCHGSHLQLSTADGEMLTLSCLQPDAQRPTPVHGSLCCAHRVPGRTITHSIASRHLDGYLTKVVAGLALLKVQP